MQVASTARGGSIPPNCGPLMNWQVAAGTGAAALAAISTAPATARHFQRRKYSDTSLISNSYPVDFTNATAVLELQHDIRQANDAPPIRAGGGQWLRQARSSSN